MWREPRGQEITVSTQIVTVKFWYPYKTHSKPICNETTLTENKFADKNCFVSFYDTFESCIYNWALNRKLWETGLSWGILDYNSTISSKCFINFLHHALKMSWMKSRHAAPWPNVHICVSRREPNIGKVCKFQCEWPPVLQVKPKVSLLRSNNVSLLVYRLYTTRKRHVGGGIHRTNRWVPD